MSEQTNTGDYSFGERIVRLSAPGAENISANASVNDVRQMTAALIDKIKDNEAMAPRLAALAITTYENACMWAVKLLTTKPEQT